MGKKKKSKRGASERKELKTNILRIFQQHHRNSFNYKQVSKKLNIRNNLTRSAISSILEELVSEGQLSELRKGKYQIKARHTIITGTVDMTLSGYAFVICDSTTEDIFISPKNINQALNGDTVKVNLFTGKKKTRPEGEIVEIITRAREEFVGTLEITKKFAFLIPDDAKMVVDVYIPLHSLKGGAHGDKAVVRITDWPDGASSPFGKVVEVLGKPGDSEVEMNAILVDHGFPLAFPEKVEEAAGKINITIPTKEIEARRDFREIPTFTIDPEDAKDFDDAISFLPLNNGNIQVGIHIADVSHYVKPGSVIDKEAYKRATSVYLVDRVIPMLPEVLSNHVCSLRPNEEKLCFSAVFELNANANVQNSWFGRTVIRSDHRFTYKQAQEIIKGKDGNFALELRSLDKLAKKIRKRRIQHGAIAFDKAEVKFQLNDEGHPVDVYFKKQEDANQLIEEFMLLANRSVAELITKPKQGAKPAFVYRIHESPDELKIETFNRFISKLGYRLQRADKKMLAQSMNKLLKEAKGTSEENMIELLAIRSMSKAEYSTNNIGHYGLAFDHYTHFTSPIRRYPDVICHRLLQKYLDGKQTGGKDEIEVACKHSSEMERNAIGAERDSSKHFQVLYMQDHVNEEFSGVISGVTEWGLYVEIIENKCEGMIRTRDIDDDYYVLDEDNFRLVGNNSGKTFQLGETLNVIVKNVDLPGRKLDFVLADS